MTVKSKELNIDSIVPGRNMHLDNNIICLTREWLFFTEEFKLVEVKAKLELEHYHFTTPCNSRQWIKAFDKKRMGAFQWRDKLLPPEPVSNLSVCRIKKIRHCDSQWDAT